LRQQRVAIARA